MSIINGDFYKNNMSCEHYHELNNINSGTKYRAASLNTTKYPLGMFLTAGGEFAVSIPAVVERESEGSLHLLPEGAG